VSESKENLPFSVARNIKDTPEQEYRTLKISAV
jgi:hypothetical protein